MDQLFVWILRHYSFGVSLGTAKAGGVAIGLIDVLLVFAFLKIAELIRARRGARRIVVRYLLLAGTLVLIPLLLMADHHGLFWMLDAVITSGHLAIIGYTLVTEGRAIMAFLAELPKPGNFG